MSFHIPLPHGNFLTLILVYTPTLDSDVPIEDEFYWQLDDLISTVTSRNKVIILGDFNARVGNYAAT